MMYKNLLSIVLLVGLAANFGQANDISNEMMNFVNMLGPMQNIIEEFYANSEQIMMKSMANPKIAAFAAEWKMLGPQITSAAQKCFEAGMEMMQEGMAGLDSSEVSSQVDSFMSAMQSMSSKSMESMGSMFNPSQMMDPTKLFGKFGKK